MKQSILLIDDSRQVRDLLSVRLRKEPLTLHSAVNAETGLELAKSLRPDVILLNMDMPNGTGREICRQLKGDPLTEPIPVIFLTTAKSGPAAFGRGNGAADILIKPLDMHQVRQKIADALRLRGPIWGSVTTGILADRTSGAGGTASMPYFIQRTQAELAHAHRTGQPLACIIVQVTGSQPEITTLPPIHAARLVGELSAFLLSASRPQDTVCNLGAGRFAILLPHSDDVDAQHVAETLLEMIQNRSWLVAGTSVGIHCSAGVADTTASVDAHLIRRAMDAASRATGGEMPVAVAA